MRKREDEAFRARREARIAKKKQELEARNELRRFSGLPIWARGLGRGQKVHIISTHLEGRVKCGKWIKDLSRSIYDSDARKCHPEIFKRHVCKSCGMVHEPETGAEISDPTSTVHLIARTPVGTQGPWGIRGSGNETVCGLPLEGARWIHKIHMPLGMCNGCTGRPFPGPLISREDWPSDSQLFGKGPRFRGAKKLPPAEID